MKKFRQKVSATSFRALDKSAQNVEERAHTYETFDIDPVTSGKGGGAATGTTGDENIMLFEHNGFEYHILGTQTILAPSLTAVGLNIAMDQTDNDGVEISQGILSTNKHVFTIGTDGPFFLRVKFKIADVSGTDDCLVGFRKAEAYQAAVDNYDEMAALNVISGAINIESILNAAATATTDTTDAWADNETITLQVNVSAAGVVTYKIDGSAPTVTAAFTFDTAEVVVPFMYFLNAAGLVDTLEIVEWECGLGQ